MRLPVVSLLCVLSVGCSRPPTPGEIADAGWKAHEHVIAAGEHARTCAEAGVAMQRAFEHDRPAFVAAFELEQDKERLAAATRFLEEHGDRYADLETRTDALAERCGDDATVDAVFVELELPARN